MNNRIIIIILSALIVILVSANFFMMKSVREMTTRPGPGHEFMNGGPEGGPPDGGPGPGMMGRHEMPGNRFGKNFCGPDFMKEKLNLDAEQIKKIQALNMKYNDEYTKYFNELKPEQDRLKMILGTENPDLAGARKILEKMASLNVELHLIKIKQGAEIDKILTTEQKERLHQERRMFFEKRHMRPDGEDE